MKYTVNIPGIPVLLNEILCTGRRFQSRIKFNGKKTHLGYKHLEPYYANLPKFKQPIILKIIIYQTKQHPIDIDSVNKTLLDSLKFFEIILDDNHKGLKSLHISYAKGFYKEKHLKLSFIL